MTTRQSFDNRSPRDFVPRDDSNNVAFTSHSLRLKGTLLIPKDASLSALLISGSGQVDRDSNHKAMATRVMRNLAEYLASHSISSLRYDKRGVGQSEGNFLTCSFDDNFDDASAAFDFLKTSLPNTKHIVIGHSEGAMHAVRLAAKRSDIDGIILLAGPAQSGEAIMKWQLGHVMSSLEGVGKWLLKILPIDPYKQHQKLLDKLSKTDDDMIKLWGVKKLNAAWLRQFSAYDPVEDFKNITCPILAITGEKDIQVPVSDLELMKAYITAPLELHAIPDLTHMLRRDSEEPSLQHYQAQIKLPLDAEMLELVKIWVLEKLGS